MTSELYNHESDVAAALDFAVDHIEPELLFEADTRKVYAAGEKIAFKTYDTEDWLPAPTAKRGDLTFHEGESFARYVNDHGEGPRTSLYADVRERRVVAVLDGHERGGMDPGWAEHRASLSLRHTPEWQAWAGRSGRLGDQTEFAEFIEEHTLEIVDPPGADMLELAQSFQANIGVAFKRAQRLDSGETHLLFQEQVEARAGRDGQIPIPQTLVVRLAVFEGDDPIDLEARLRYRIRDGHLAIGVQLVRAEDAVRASFDRVLAGIEGETQIEAYRGVAPAAGRAR